MASWKVLLIFGLVFTASLCRVAAEEAEAEEASVEDEDDYADQERAHLLVRKWFKDQATGSVEGDTPVVQGRNLTVYIELYNAGTSTATNIQVTDGELPSGFSVLEGKGEASFTKLEVGSKVVHTYTLNVNDAVGLQQFEAAKVTYKADADGEEQKTSSTVAFIEVLTPAQQLQKYLLVGGKYISLGMMHTATDWLAASIVLGVLGVVLGGNSAYKSASTARTNIRRKKALASLEKDE